MFERFVNRKRRLRNLSKWEHEHASVQLFHRLLNANDINLTDYGLEECDEMFIVRLIEVGSISSSYVYLYP